MTYNCPKQLLGDLDRILLLLFDFCRTDEELAARRQLQKNAGELKAMIDKSCNLGACRAEKKICERL